VSGDNNPSILGIKSFCDSICQFYCVVPEKPIPTPQKVIGNSKGKGRLKNQNFRLKAKYEAKVEFLGGEGGGFKTKTFCGGSMDIFWNYTLTATSLVILSP